MATQRTVWATADGRQFSTQAAAEQHERVTDLRAALEALNRGEKIKLDVAEMAERLVKLPDEAVAAITAAVASARPARPDRGSAAV